MRPDQVCLQLNYGGTPSYYQATLSGDINQSQFTFPKLPQSQQWTVTETGASCAGGPVLPAEYIQLDWIQSTGTQCPFLKEPVVGLIYGDFVKKIFSFFSGAEH